jgi:hypothetical protein
MGTVDLCCVEATTFRQRDAGGGFRLIRLRLRDTLRADGYQMKARNIRAGVVAPALVWWGIMFSVSQSNGETVNFDDAKIGEPPAGWTATKTGKREAKWSRRWRGSPCSEIT